MLLFSEVNIWTEFPILFNKINESQKALLIMFYNQNCFSKPLHALIIFSGNSQFLKIVWNFFYVSFASSFLFWNGVIPFLLIIQGVPKNQQKNFDFGPFLVFWTPLEAQMTKFQKQPPWNFKTDHKSMTLSFQHYRACVHERIHYIHGQTACQGGLKKFSGFLRARKHGKGGIQIIKMEV